jgi:hypothetical protein
MPCRGRSKEAQCIRGGPCDRDGSPRCLYLNRPAPRMGFGPYSLQLITQDCTACRFWAWTTYLSGPAPAKQLVSARKLTEDLISRSRDQILGSRSPSDYESRILARGRAKTGNGSPACLAGLTRMAVPERLNL